jgi:hypothetical protein
VRIFGKRPVAPKVQVQVGSTDAPKKAAAPDYWDEGKRSTVFATVIAAGTALGATIGAFHGGVGHGAAAGGFFSFLGGLPVLDFVFARHADPAEFNRRDPG